jgi:hypothetical protein
MANIGNFHGINFESSDSKTFGNFEGFNLESSNEKIFGRFEGVNFDSTINVTFQVRDAVTSLLINTPITLFNVTYPLDLLSNGYTRTTGNEHHIFLENDSTINVQVVLLGYNFYSNQFIIDSELDNYIEILLTPTTSVPLTCDSYISDKNNFELENIIDGRENYVNCEFKLSDFTSPFDYTVVFTAFPKNGSKNSGIELVSEYIGSTGIDLYKWRAKIVGLPKNVYITSSIRKRL